MIVRPNQAVVPETVIASPAIESLLNLIDEDSFWPEVVRGNPGLVEQVRSRTSLAQALADVFDQLAPKNLDIKEAVGSGQLESRKVIRAYHELAALLESDSESRRLILYLPFEFLPQGSWFLGSDSLAQAATRLNRVYLKRWYELLWFSDVRENFVEGDVLEPGLRSVPLRRVVKAAHLVPKLVERGLLSVAEVKKLIEANRGNILGDSLTEAALVLNDLGLMPAHDLEGIKTKAAIIDPTPSIITPARRRWLERREREK
ncbi:MAG: hypothetical protein AAB455_03810, partial [Patescibacteria group bacterium]